MTKSGHYDQSDLEEEQEVEETMPNALEVVLEGPLPSPSQCYVKNILNLQYLDNEYFKLEENDHVK